MHRKLAGMATGLVGVVMAAGGLFGMPDSAAQPHACIHIDGNVGMTTVTFDREDNCPAIPPTDPDVPCPGGVGHYSDTGNTQVSFEVLVCARGF